MAQDTRGDVLGHLLILAIELIMKLTKAALQRLKKRAKIAMTDYEKWMKFSISPEAILAILEKLEDK